MAKLTFLDPKSIVIPADRQRKAFTTEDLEASVAKHGVIQPIVVRIVDGQAVLIAGERRLTTAIKLGLKDVPVHDFETLSDLEHSEIELEENVKRKDLTWQEHAEATYKLHLIYAQQVADPDDWTKEGTAERIGLSARQAGRLINLGEALSEGDESIAKADSLASAYTIYERRKKRATDEAVQQLFEMAAKPVQAPAPSSVLSEGAVEAQEGGEPDGDAEPLLPPVAPFKIVEADALDFFSTYSGDRFNFLHCDLPYGVELHGQANQDAFEGGGYDSNPEIYWRLLDAIIAGWDNVMFPSAHIMFWFAFTGNGGEGFYQETIERLERIPGMRINRNPLVWLKSDNRGILADPKRGPRNITEFALLGSTQDRFIVKPVANAYSAPTAKGDSIHTNEKPIPMLSHFFQMLVDEHTRILDPTAGSGSAIRAAELAGAELGLGLEFNGEFAQRAQRRLETERGLRKLAGGK